MKNIKSRAGQVSTEYLIVIGFVSFFIIIILGTAYLYVGSIKDKIKVNQIELFANKVINTAESIYYSGEPSKTTISVYLPQGVQNIEIQNNNLIITFSTSTGTNKISYSCKVPIEGTIPTSHGTKTLKLVAKTDRVEIS